MLASPRPTRPPRALIPLSLLLALLTIELLPAQLPSLRSRFSSIPCLAPIIRQIDPDAPNDVEEAMVLPPYQGPKRVDNIGTVSFPISSPNPEAQAWFNQGMALLHAFWYGEAERAFRQVVALDPSNPMAFWGLALANETNPRLAEIYLQRAHYELTRRTEITPREKQWIRAFLDYYQPDHEPLSAASDEEALARRAQRIRALEDLAYEHPDDIEARAFLLRYLTLDEHRAGVPITSHFTADTLAQNIHEQNPDHPSRHYRSFLWLNENPARALDSAAENTAIAPGVPDAYRFAAQVFNAAEDFPNASRFGEAALRAAHNHMAGNLVMPDDMENYVANAAAHIDTLVSTGNPSAAVAAAENLIRLPRSAYLDERDTLDDALQGAYFTGTRSLAQSLMRLEQWQQLLDAADSPLLDPDTTSPASETPWVPLAHRAYWKAIAHLNLDQFAEADAQQQELDELFRRYRTEGTTNDIKEEIIRCIRSLKTVKALHTAALKDAPDLEREPLLHITPDHLARLLHKAGFTDEALALAAADLAQRPAQFLATANFCDLHQQAGKNSEVMRTFDSRFRHNAAAADPTLPIFARLRAAADQLNFPSKWTLDNPEKPTGPDPLPNPDNIGLLTYSPPEAPGWSLPDHENTSLSLDSYAGKPLVAHFFLGVGCVFCVEQLKKFSPLVEDFKNAGIEMIAVSTDSQEELAESLGDPDKPSFPFPIVADPDLEQFKAYRVHDDFENKPMHATFLIGPDGHILWSDIGHEPFMYPEFLLAEAQRLLPSSEPADD
ncbi:MAG: redoxin domain-containing protein [Verrucomicrobiota bacterium]